MIKSLRESVSIRSFSGPYFPAFGLNTDQKNSEYGHFPRSECYLKFRILKKIRKSAAPLYLIQITWITSYF